MLNIGRPTKYTPELLAAAKMYLLNYQANGEVIPTIEGLALTLGVSRETLHTWARDADKYEFSDIYTKLMEDQAKTLIGKGLEGKFQPTITKLMLSKHGYRDTSEVEHNGNLSVNVIKYDPHAPS